MYFRLKDYKITKTYLRILLPAPVSIEINGSIAGGLYIPHTYAVVSVKRAGRNLSVLPGVIVGKKESGKLLNTHAIIKNDVILCSNSTIIGSVNIGNNVVVGAGSVVVKDVPEGCVVVGNPAHIINTNINS